MADELATVEQRFTADIEAYVRSVDAAARDARDFARANTEASDAASRMRDHAETEAIALGHLRDEALLAAEAEKKLDDTSVSARSRLMALGSAAGHVTGLADAFSVFNSKASMASRVLSGFSLATGLLEAPMAGLIVGVGALASGLAAAGIGMAAFGLVAKAAYSNVTPAVNAYETAMNTSGKAAATAMKQYQQYMAALTPQQQAMARSLISAHNAWNNFVSSNTSGVAKIMSQGIGLLPKVFASLQPFMAPVEHALHGLITQLGQGLNSSGFKSFIDMMASNSGPAITKLGDAIGHVVVGIGGILKAFMPMAQTVLSGLDRITAKFATWGTTLTSHSGFQSLVSMAKADMPYVIDIVKQLGAAFVHLGGSMTGLSTFSNSKMLLQIADPLAHLVNYLSQANPALLRFGLYALAAGGAVNKMKPAFQGISAGITAVKGGASAFEDLRAGLANSAAAASEATGVWGSVGGAISTAITAVKGWTIWSKIAAAATKAWEGVQIAFDAVMDANPIALLVIAIIALIAIIVLLVTHLHETAHIFDMVRHAASTAFDDIRHSIAAAFDWVRAHWPLLLAILTGPIGVATMFIVSHWHQILTGAQHMISDVTGWFRRLPGMILSAVGNLGSLLWNAGVAVVRGLIDGIKSMFGALGSVASSIGSFIAGLKGPLPKDLTLLVPHGQAIMQGLMNGITSKRGELAALLAGVTGGIPAAAGTGLAGRGAAGGPGGPLRVNVPLSVAFGAGLGGLAHDPRFLQYIQAAVQEAVLRYTNLNPSNGLSLGGKLA